MKTLQIRTAVAGPLAWTARQSTTGKTTQNTTRNTARNTTRATTGITRIRLCLLSCLGFLALCGPFHASSAQPFPSMPIRIVVGYAPGGAPDSIARTLAKGLSPILGQTVYVENKPGAASLLGARYVANAPADGYMLYMADNPTHVMVKHLVSGLSFDPVKDFSTVALIGGPPMILLASGKSGIRSVADLIKLAQASPGKLSYGSTGVGGVHHMVMEIFNHKAGISVTHIPYKGSGQSIPALMGGEIDLLLVGLNSYLPMRNDPRVRAIGFTSSGRLEECPDVPPLSDFVPGFEFASDLGVLAPAGIPPDVQTKLSLSIKEALATREVTEGLKAMAIKVTYMGPAQYSDYLGQVSRKFEEAVQQIGLELTPPSK